MMNTPHSAARNATVIVTIEAPWASRIVVSDPFAERREAAARFGATDALAPTDADVVASCHELTRGIGVDYAFDAAGHPDLLGVGLAATRRGGTTVGVGVSGGAQELTISAASHVMGEKKLLGVLVTVVRHPDDGHLIARARHVRDALARTIAWFRGYLGRLTSILGYRRIGTDLSLPSRYYREA